MKKGKHTQRFLSMLLTAVLAFSSMPATAFAADAGQSTERIYPYTYTSQTPGYDAVKVSHPDVAPNYKRAPDRTNDGILDYIGEGRLTDDIGTRADSGDRGQNYTWAAIGYGDWVYASTLYNALVSTVGLMGSALGHQFDSETMGAALDVLYNGDYYYQESDEGNPGSTLCKINVKTGEVKIVMSQATTGQSCSFRNVCEYQGKFYFCGSVNGAPQIWQVDPKTDECKMVYGLSRQEFGAGFMQGISSGIRGLCAFADADGEELIVSSVQMGKGGKILPTILSSKDPEKGFEVIATYEDLFEYPAYHYRDSIYGGSIWEMAKYNDKLYVSLCTGTPENKPDEYTMQSFALVCGEKKDGRWQWSPVVGDTEDGARYPFGIDPERTRAGAAVLTVYNGYLYIGEYNDEEIAMEEIMFNLDFQFMNENLEQSVRLYRMDENENIELIVGDPSEMFPKGGTSGFSAGFDCPENQYVWRMTEHNGKLYVGTFDTSSLLQPLGQFANMDIWHMTPNQWEQLLGFIQKLLAMTEKPDDSAAQNGLAKSGSARRAAPPQLTEEEQKAEELRSLFEEYDNETLADIFCMLAEEETSDAEIMETLEDAGIEDSPVVDTPESTEPEDRVVEEAPEDAGNDDSAVVTAPEGSGNADAPTENVPENIEEDISGEDIPETTDRTVEEINEDALTSPSEMVLCHNAAKSSRSLYQEADNKSPEQMENSVESVKRLFHIAKHLLITARYMRDADRGFDLYVSEDGVHFDTVTTNGFGDPFNHGLRVYAETNDGLCIGTANPFYGTQIWLQAGSNEETEITRVYAYAQFRNAADEKVAPKDVNGAASLTENDSGWLTLGYVDVAGEVTLASVQKAIADGKLECVYNTDLDLSQVEWTDLQPDVWGADGFEDASDSCYHMNGKIPVYTITYTDGVEGETIFADQTYRYYMSGAATPDFAGMPSREGYTFLGWGDDFSDTVSGDAIYTAQWKEGEAAEYGVTYNYDNSVPAEVMSTLPTNSYTYSVGQKVTTAAKPEDVVVGDYVWKFQTWQLNGVDVAPNTQIEMVRGGLTFTGVWTREAVKPAEYTVTFDANGGSVSPASAITGTDGRLSDLPTPTRSGSYSFDGWYTAVSGGEKVTASTVFAENSTIYAHWTRTGGGSSGGSHSGGSTSYAITVADAENGSATASHKSASKGTTITVTATPDKGYELDTLKVTDKNGDKVKLTEKNGKYTFTMPASAVTVKATFTKTAENPFTDINDDAYYKDAVIWAVENGITKGISGTMFSPDAACTRAQAVTFLWRAAGSPVPKTTAMPFADVKAGSYYYDAVLWAVENGITKGTSDTTFSPDVKCTRAQIVTFLWRSQKSPAAASVNVFNDVAADAYYADAVNWAVAKGITSGTSAAAFSPNADCTRGQIVTFLYRCLGK